MSAAEKTSETVLRVNEKKWTKTLMKAGWTVLPNVLFEFQSNLGLDPLDINILLHIASYWWDAEGKPHPSKVRIANAMNVNPRTVQRRIAAMEKAGFIHREERRIPGQGSKTNVYHLDGLIKATTGFAEMKIDENAKKKQIRDARAKRRGKPNLILVKNEQND